MQSSRVLDIISDFYFNLASIYFIYKRGMFYWKHYYFMCTRVILKISILQLATVIKEALNLDFCPIFVTVSSENEFEACRTVPNSRRRRMWETIIFRFLFPGQSRRYSKPCWFLMFPVAEIIGFVAFSNGVCRSLTTICFLS